MALINCTECGKEASDQAKACPHCGAKKFKPKKPMSNSMKYILAALFAAMLLPAIFSSPPPSAQAQPGQPKQAEPKTMPNWVYSESIDTVSGKAVKYATATSHTTHHFSPPYQGGTGATLQFRKHPRFGKDVIFDINKGQLICSAGEGCAVTLRIDDSKPFQVHANGPEDYSSTTLFLSGYQNLLGKIKNGKKLVVAANFYQEGQPAFEFNIADLKFD